jgi:hypothetical protein
MIRKADNHDRAEIGFNSINMKQELRAWKDLK